MQEYDLHLNNGRLLEHFHEGNMTYRTEGIREKVPCTFVEVSPELASARGIQTGTWVRLASRYGEVKAQAVVTHARQRQRTLHADELISRTGEPLTSSCTDKVTHTPAYKETSVQLTVLSQKGDNPLPRTNPRYGHPTPQTGVEVERKWARSDYHLPGNGLVQIETRTAVSAGQEK